MYNIIGVRKAQAAKEYSKSMGRSALDGRVSLGSLNKTKHFDWLQFVRFGGQVIEGAKIELI